MRPETVDRLSRLLGGTTSRPGAVRVLFGALAGAAAAGALPRRLASQSACPPAQVCGSHCCPNGNVCAGGTCVNLLATPAPAAGRCAQGQVLSLGLCCPQGQKNRGGICCPRGQRNSDGICCPSGTLNSRGIYCPDEDFGQGVNIGEVCCLALQACGNSCCAADQYCVDGGCCPTAQICAGVCCPAGQACLIDSQSGLPACCAALQVPSASPGICCAGGTTPDSRQCAGGGT
jgi:hypothetical protein